MKNVFLFASFLISTSAFALSGQHTYNYYDPASYDVCQTQFTMQHYMQSRCFEISRPVLAEGGEQFKLRAVLITTDLATAAERPSLVLIPGGPGESSGMLRWVLNEKDMLNGMMKYLNVNIVLFDPRGTGTSIFTKPVSHYEPKVVSTRLMTDDLSALVDAVSPGKPVYLLSHSAGGSVAVQFALQHPERVAKMILASSSTSPREMALLNLEGLEKKSAVWERFLAAPAHRSLALGDLDQKYHAIEDAIAQQQKARILRAYVHPTFKPVSVPQWRDEIQVDTELDPKGVLAAEEIQKSYTAILEAEKIQALAPAALRERKLREEDMIPLKFEGEEWIKAAVMCGEGLTNEEMNTEIYLDGITMARFCNKMYAAGAADLVTTDLGKVRAPVLFLAGLKDVQVPPVAARRIVSALPNATLVMEPKAGHAVFYEAPATFFHSLEKFLAP